MNKLKKEQNKNSKVHLFETIYSNPYGKWMCISLLSIMFVCSFEFVLDTCVYFYEFGYEIGSTETL